MRLTSRGHHRNINSTILYIENSLYNHFILQEVENKTLAVTELSKALDETKTAAKERESNVREEMERTREGTEQVRPIRDRLADLCSNARFGW